ncbi:MAG TPA: sterol desaturase family protein, partial [Syntrophales bacterium]|nr:sterol desaturase family protein [Syntrophales bacterium]
MERLPVDIIGYEIPIRIGCFVAIFAAMAVYELLAPRRILTTPKSLRWVNNLSLQALNTALIRGLFPILPITSAFIAVDRGWGVLNNYHLPPWSAVIIGAIALDCAIYLQHVAFHTVPVFWRLHMIHHTDMDIDLTTGVRFHPVEMILSMFIKMAAIIILGAPPLAVLIFEVALNESSIFTHSNVFIPGGLDRALRMIFVTPD